MDAPVPEPGPPAAAATLLGRVRGVLTLSRVQAILGLVAALLSIGGSLYAYLWQQTKPAAPTTGRLVTLVQEARSGQPLADATVEVLRADALVTTLAGAGGRAEGSLPEGTYRLRVSHPRYAPETRQVHVIAGHTAEVRVALGGRAAAARPAPAEPSPVDEAARAVKKGVDAVRRIFD